MCGAHELQHLLRRASKKRMPEEESRQQPQRPRDHTQQCVTVTGHKRRSGLKETPPAQQVAAARPPLTAPSPKARLLRMQNHLPSTPWGTRRETWMDVAVISKSHKHAFHACYS
jgi:hypothetical protein